MARKARILMFLHVFWGAGRLREHGPGGGNQACGGPPLARFTTIYTLTAKHAYCYSPQPGGPRGAGGYGLQWASGTIDSYLIQWANGIIDAHLIFNGPIGGDPSFFWGGRRLKTNGQGSLA